MKNLSSLDWVAIILVIIGGINWLLVGLLNFDLVAALFGTLSSISRIVYVVVGLAAVYLLITSMRFGKKA